MAQGLTDASPPDLSRLRIDRDRPAERPRRATRRNLLLAAAAAAAVVAALALLRGPGAVEVRTALAEVRGGEGAGGGPGAALITANGYVVARTQASVSSKISGRLESLSVSEGSYVRKGDVIARLEHADYAAALAASEAGALAAEAALREAEVARDQWVRDERRARELMAAGLIASQEAESAAASLAAAEARVTSARAQAASARAGTSLAAANLENTVIRAPFDGTVLRKDAEVGEIVAPAVTGGGLTRGAVVTMADLATLEVEVDVNEAYIAQIRSAQPCRITLDAYPAESFRGEVRQVVPTADRQRATVQVKVSILDRDPRILTEMGARVDFLAAAPAGGEAGAAAASASRVVVPAAAVVSEGGGAAVWMVREGKAVRRAVEAGPVSGGVREVRSGLGGGETLVISGFESLREGVRVVTPETR